MSLILRTTYLNFGNRALVYFGMYQMYYSGVYRKDIIYLLIKVQRGNRNHLVEGHENFRIRSTSVYLLNLSELHVNIETLKSREIQQDSAFGRIRLLLKLVWRKVESSTNITASDHR
ncbi:hypothetical protein RCL_jg697.t1 [Rhizophagus clarus]|uniref:Uncharacterized protein n=1 Tax=Rhizophagus clarus TaxID=94130 RepID=A0A8H3LCD6_9GLOM|nr:hypothetical protein RCL_jg697.t1 [Rhizophagus clarus]